MYFYFPYNSTIKYITYSKENSTQFNASNFTTFFSLIGGGIEYIYRVKLLNPMTICRDGPLYETSTDIQMRRGVMIAGIKNN